MGWQGQRASPRLCHSNLERQAEQENESSVGAKFDDYRSRTVGRDPGQPPEVPAASEVAAFLERHPDFLNDRPELLEALTPPATRRGRRVLDMQYFMVARLQRTVREMKDREADLVTATQIGRAHV